MNARLTEHDRRLWGTMISQCESFLRREVSLKRLVTDLEGLLDAGEFRAEDLREQWYSLWSPLEIRNAMGETGWSPEAAQEVAALRSFLDKAV